MITFDIIECADDLDIFNIVNQTENLDSVFSGIEYIEHYNFNNGPWWYLIRKESLGDLRFVNGRYGEDGMFTVELLMKIKRIAHVSRKCYCYVRHPNTTTTRRNIEHQRKIIDDYLFVYHHMQNLIEDNKSNLTKKAIDRCSKRAESYIFFLLIRLITYKGERQFIRDKVKDLRAEHLYPIAKPYSGLRYDVVSVIVNHYPILILANILYNALSKRR